MSSVIASRRYALALLSVAEEGQFLDETTKALESIKTILDGSRDLVHALRSPLINGDQKTRIIEAIFSGVVGEKVMVFLRLLARKKRIGQLPEIVTEFCKLLDERNGIISVEVDSAVMLTEEQSRTLVDNLASYTGKKIRMKIAQKEELLGGLTVKIGDTILDGSVLHQLQLMQKTLAAGSL